MFCEAATACWPPGRCEEKLSTFETIGLALLMCLPMLFALCLPKLNSLATHEKPIAGSLMCSIPSACASTGLIVIIFVFCAAIVPTFFMVALSASPCMTGIGECSTISCAAGNAYSTQGYTFMFCTLVLLSFTVVHEAARLPAVTRTHRRLKASLCLGGVVRSPPVHGNGCSPTF